MRTVSKDSEPTLNKYIRAKNEIFIRPLRVGAHDHIVN